MIPTPESGGCRELETNTSIDINFPRKEMLSHRSLLARDSDAALVASKCLEGKRLLGKGELDSFLGLWKSFLSCLSVVPTIFFKPALTYGLLCSVKL